MNLPKLLEEAADMVTEQSAEHAQACRHAAVALSLPSTLLAPALTFDAWWEQQTEDFMIMPSQAVKAWAFRAWRASNDIKHTDQEKS